MKLYKINLNWYGEVYNFWSYALSEKEAMVNGFQRLAKKLKIWAVKVHGYYKKHPDGWKVTEWEEKNESR